MSLDTLPSEVYKLVVDLLGIRAWRSLCLTSKGLLHLTRPFLYRSISLTLSEWSWFEWRSDGKQFRPHNKRIRDYFFRSFSNLPQLASHITSLELVGDPSLFNRSVLLFSTVSLLQEAQNLRHLTIARPVPGQDYFSHTLVDAIPSTLTSLTIRHRPIEEEDLTALLNRLTSLTAFDTSEMHIEWKIHPALLLTQSFRKLRFLTVDECWSPFLELLLRRATRLEHFYGPFFASRFLVPLDLSKLTSLALISDHSLKRVPGLGLANAIGSRPRSISQVTSEVAPLLKQAPSLRVFKVHLEMFCDFFDRTIPPVTMLDHLPNKLRSLSFSGIRFFHDRDLLRYLASSARSPRLWRLELPVKRDEKPNEIVKEVCRDRRIKVSFAEWTDGRD